MGKKTVYQALPPQPLPPSSYNRQDDLLALARLYLANRKKGPRTYYRAPHDYEMEQPAIQEGFGNAPVDGILLDDILRQYGR